MKDSGLIPIVGLIFITLKLTGYINWSWWWVLSPFWIEIILVTLLISIPPIFYRLKRKWQNK